MFIESKKVTLHRETNIMQCTRLEKTISIESEKIKIHAYTRLHIHSQPPKSQMVHCIHQICQKVDLFLYFKFIPRF